MKHYKFIAVFLLSFNHATGNFNGNDTIKSLPPILYEKIFLHVDRELYLHGDEVWFKSYLTGGINNKLISGYKNIYVQLIYEDGTVYQNRLLLSVDGISHGSFTISDTLPDGNYTIRARTKYLENFGEESYFHKKIIIWGKQKVIMPAQKKTIDSVEIDVSFLPEGGSFVLNAKNNFAFKIIDKKGRGIGASGKIVDEDGNEITRFRTTYKGMGTLSIMPVEGKTYHAYIDGFPDLIYHFNEAVPEGISLDCKIEQESVLLIFNRNFNQIDPIQIQISGQHKGIELFKESKILTNFQESFKIGKQKFPRGISKITVQTLSGEVLCERLIFVEGKTSPMIKFDLNKPAFKTRDEILIETKALLSDNDTISTTCSVAVVNSEYFAANGSIQTLESYLLLDSDLKGSIENPANYFTDDDTISSINKLDLLMLVNGWSSYYWNELESYKGKELPNWADIGVSVKGNVTGLWNKTPIPNCNVKLGPFSRNLLFEETLTDSLGKYSFDKLYLKDQATIMINAKSRKDGRRTEINYSPTLKYANAVWFDPISKILPFSEIPLRFYREIFSRQLDEKEYNTQNILLGQIDIVREKSNYDGHFRLYGEADASFTITKDDNNYLNVLDYLYGKVAGVTISGDAVRIRNSSRNPLLIVDGIKTEWNFINYISMNDIDKIEVLKSGVNLSIHGSEGADGVIAVYTKMGNTEVEIEKYMPARITPKITGFEKPKQFYSPKYPLENNIISKTDTNVNQDNSKPDYRTTLYWEPNLKFENNKAQLEFYSSDKTANYYVILEGITKNGKIISEMTSFSVTEKRK